MEAAISAIRTHDTHKLLSAKAAFLRLSPDEKARFARFFEAEAQKTTILRRRAAGAETQDKSVEAIRKANRRTERKFGVKVSMDS